MYWVCMFVKAILRLAKMFVKEDRYMRSAKNTVFRISCLAFRLTLLKADLKFEGWYFK